MKPNLFAVFRQPELRFLNEQVGSPEDHLKTALTELFTHEIPEILSASLAVVGYMNGDKRVALCLAASASTSKTAVVERVSDLFKSIFREKQSLDIIFLEGSQEHDLRKVCSSFYES